MIVRKLYQIGTGRSACAKTINFLMKRIISWAAVMGSSAQLRWKRKSYVLVGHRYERGSLGGQVRFNDLRRGLPRMSPTLLSKRLKELEAAGVIQSLMGAKGVRDYNLTAAGEELRTLVMGIGVWGQRGVERVLSNKCNQVSASRKPQSVRLHRGHATRPEQQHGSA